MLSQQDQQSLKSVSYTHLDVYKRQGLIVPPTYSVEKNVAELKELEEKINAWEDKAKKVLSGKLVTMYVYRSFIYQIPI